MYFVDHNENTYIYKPAVKQLIILIYIDYTLNVCSCQCYHQQSYNQVQGWRGISPILSI